MLHKKIREDINRIQKVVFGHKEPSQEKMLLFAIIELRESNRSLMNKLLEEIKKLNHHISTK